jgi:uncharacterized protein (TIGR02598 family)
MISFPLTPGKFLPRRAFSLVEVAMALGIMSVVVTSLLALMPVGLNIFRDSLETSVQADILRRLSTEFRTTPFNQIAALEPANMRLFSDEGAEVSRDSDALLGVSYAVTNSTPLLQGASYQSANLKTVRVSFFTRQDRARTPQTPSLETVLFVPASGR